MGQRRRARELALQVLFHLEYSPGDYEEAFRLVCRNFKVPSTAKGYAGMLVNGVCEKREELDKRIREASRNWRLERMSRVDRNILRLGSYEVIFLKEVPTKVAIDEAVELGKRYGSKESGAFINGVLDHILNATSFSEDR
jgi:transcription antitermination factor NusB